MQLKDVEEHVVDALGVGAYYIVVCDFREQNLTLMIPWCSLSLNTLQTILCSETE